MTTPATATARVAADFTEPGSTAGPDFETDDSPATTPKATPRVLYFYCAENRVEDDPDGGLVLFQPVRGQHPEQLEQLQDFRLALVFKQDAPMREYPVTREEKQRMFYELTLRPVTEAELPPDPRAPRPPSAFDILAQARDAAAREGRTELAAALDRQLADGVAASPSPSVSA